MAHPVRMPKPGQMTEECTITRWYKREGDPVRQGDALFEIETDKATMDVEAFDDGVLLRRLFGEGDTVPVNTICAYIGEPGEVVPTEPEAVAPAPIAASAPAPAPTEPEVSPAPAPTAAPTPEPPPAPAPSIAPPAPALEPRAPGRGPSIPGVSPRAARLASARGVDLSRVVGTGPGGRVVERDVLAAIAGGLVGPTPASASVAGRAAIESTDGGRARPVEHRGVGPSTAPALPVDEEAPRPLGRMRRVIAERLTSGWATTPQFSVTVAADVTPLVGFRTELRGAGYDLSLTDFVLAAAAQTLVEFPDLNARTDGVLLWPRRRIHLGLAVAVPGGLLLPVIRDADRLSLLEIHAVATRLIERARAGTLGPDELSGSTFTVSNLGMLGVESFQAIVNPGESAILAVGSATPEAVVAGEGIGIRTMMRLTLSADHRIVDGELAARFLGALRRRLVDLRGWRALLDRE